MRCTNAKRFVVLAVFALSIAAFPTATGAQEMLVIADADGTVLGPVLSVVEPRDPKGDSYLFVYRMGSDFAILKALSTGTFVLSGADDGYLYFSSLDCTEEPAFGRPDDSELPTPDPTLAFPGPILFGVESGEIFRVDMTSATPAVVVSSKRPAWGYPAISLPCMPITPAARTGYPVSLIGSISFTLPLAVVINPLIFNDGFGTGNPNRWSNY